MLGLRDAPSRAEGRWGLVMLPAVERDTGLGDAPTRGEGCWGW